MQRYSVATLDSPEFLNIIPYNPLHSKCEVKVFYLGQNRNGSIIDRESADEMAKTLPGSPIVGYYNNDIKDFEEHNEKIVIEDGELKFISKTVPYGFIIPNAKVWFKDFEELDKNNNKVIRKYLMSEGLLWTGIYEESQRIIKKGNNVSMELDGDTIKGEWANVDNSNVSFFIINDAIFSKICILGEHAEPCFEGASITAPTLFTANDNFSKTLYSMMNELKFALNQEEGGLEVEKELNEGLELTVEDTPAEVTETTEVDATEQVSETESIEYSLDDITEYQDLLTKYSKLEEDYNTLVAEATNLRKFKLSQEKIQKEEMIAKFYCLSDDLKKDVIDKIDQYSLSEIEAELAVICFRNNINFNLETNNIADGGDDDDTPPTTYSLNMDENIPAWLKELRERKKNNI